MTRIVRLGALPSLCLWLAACGDDTGDGDPTGTSSTTTTTATSSGTDTNGSQSSTTSGSDSNSNTATTSGTGSDSTSGSDGTETTSETTSEETGTETGTETTGTTEEEADAGVLIDALCAWTHECCTDGERDSLLGPHFGDVEDCRARLRDELLKNDQNPPTNNLNYIDGLLFSLAYEVDLTRSEPIPEGIAACLEEIENRDCNDDPADPTVVCIPHGEDACALNKLFRGLVEAGGECNGRLRGPERDIECARGSSCEDTNLEVADARRRVPPDSEDVFKCVTKGLEGDLCNPSANDDESEGPCEYGYYCAPDGHCAELPGEGDACAFAIDDQPHVTDWFSLYGADVDPDIAFGSYKGNESIPCAIGLNCDPVNNVCVKWCDDGANCDGPTAIDNWGSGDVTTNGLEDQAEMSCAEGLSCLPHEFATNVGTFYFHCREPGGVGDNCNDDGDCADDYYCHGTSAAARRILDDDDGVAGTCKIRLAEGAACDPDQTQCGTNFFCGACGLLEHRSESGDLSDDPIYGDCDIDGDGDVDVGGDDDDDDGEDDRANTVTHVCQPVLPISTDATHLCAGELGTDLADTVEYDDTVCRSGSWCAYSDKLSNGDGVDADYYCISSELGSNVACAPGETGSYREYFEFVSNQDPNLPWSNSCKDTFICYDADSYTAPTCRAGVAEGQPCDYDVATESKGHCAFDLHCVAGTCIKFLQPGDACDSDSNDWDAADAEVIANGFDEPRCDPFSSSCQEIHGGYYCLVHDQVTYVRNYCIETGGSN
jgi:hypothetical protein